MEFLPFSIRIAPIRQDDSYEGLRATLDVRMGKARLRVRIDVGIGDAVAPARVARDMGSSVMTRLPAPHRLATASAIELLSGSFEKRAEVSGLGGFETWRLLHGAASQGYAGVRPMTL